VQVAFYGGSFTGLPTEKQQALLGAVQPYMKKGLVGMIRLSTRPDYIDAGEIALLREYGVGCVELGVQSMDAAVLAASGRHYRPGCVEAAVSLLRAAGMEIGLQMMVGLPGETTGSILLSTGRIADLQPDFVRIYPVLVIEGTGLHRLYTEGEYRPLSMNKAVALAGRIKEIFDRRQIRVVRMGLQASEELAARLVAGPYHPAFGELVNSRLLFKQTRQALRAAAAGDVRRISIAPRDQSSFRGPYNMNVTRLRALGLMKTLELSCDPLQERQTVIIKEQIEC
jgi:histone acetyltransferase (RNA polymerase elongator complex component)